MADKEGANSMNEMSSTPKGTSGNLFSVFHKSTQKTNIQYEHNESYESASNISQDLVNPKDLFDSLKDCDDKDIKSALQTFARAYESIYNKQICTSSKVNNLSEIINDVSLESKQLADHVNVQITKLEDDLAIHKDTTDDRLLSLKVTSDIRHSKQYLKIFMRNEERMKNINKVNVRNEAMKVLKEMELDLKNITIANAETRYERRSLFGPVRFIKHIVITFNDCVTAERLLVDFMKKSKNENDKNAQNNLLGTYYNNSYYLELPSTFEMRKVMSVCKELKSKENIASVFYGPESVRVIMKKEDPNDKDEIPKKFDVSNLHEVDKMRKKFFMKQADIPAKQLFNKDYWTKKKDMINDNSKKKSQQSKRRLEKSFEGSSSNGNAKKGKNKSMNNQNKPAHNSNNYNNKAATTSADVNATQPDQ